jgi:hypothetical protein
MNLVYKTAQLTLAVLSGPTEDTDFLFDRKNWTAETTSISQARMFNTMLEVQANDYWRRTWNLQEIVLAKERILCCGNRSAKFSDILGLFRHLETHRGKRKDLLGTFSGSFYMSLQAEPWYDSKSHVSADGGRFRSDDESLLSTRGRSRFEDANVLDLLAASRRFNRGRDARDLL